MLTLKAFCTVGRCRLLQRRKDLDLKSLWKGHEQKVTSFRSWDGLEGVQCKNVNRLGKFRMILRMGGQMPEVATASSAGLGGKPVPSGQEAKKKVIQPLGRWRVGTRQLQRSCFHPESLNPAPKDGAMLWEFHQGNVG